MHVLINPVGNMNLLSKIEIEQLHDAAKEELQHIYRSCSLAVLNAGSHTDNAEEIFKKYQDFAISVIRRERGIKIELTNPPKNAFVDGKIIKGIKELLSAVLRDIVFTNHRYLEVQRSNIAPSEQNTHIVFDILRNANAILPDSEPNLITCWGGHSINPTEYKYTKDVGYQLGLRGFNICTGCGPGAMKGPMKGATIGHAKQRINNGRYLGLTEPSIIAAEPPNPIVNELVIMPDIEKRLEGFVRLSHGIIIFPGGAGTAEELLYILGILLHDNNKAQKLPIILTGPASSENYFTEIDDFIAATLGPKAQALYQIIIDDSVKVAKVLKEKLIDVIEYRNKTGDGYHFNWSLEVDNDFQSTFEPSHANMSQLVISKELPTAELAANLRRVFSGIVAGNVKSEGIQSIRDHGPFKISGQSEIMHKMDKLLRSFVEQERMKLPGSVYTPCYEIIEE